MDKPTLVLGASASVDRTSFTAVHRLRQLKHTVYALGRTEGSIDDVEIQQQWPANTPLNTITIYLNAAHQSMYYDKIIKTHPQRVIFNPGAENPELEALLLDYDIEVLEACTLVLLATNQY